MAFSVVVWVESFHFGRKNGKRNTVDEDSKRDRILFRFPIEQRIYAGEIDDPKTDSSKRVLAVPPATAALLREWMAIVPENEDA